jgi:uncharacterized membrane protein HdeD (DUF308 family)
MANDGALIPQIAEEFHHHSWTLIEGTILLLLGTIVITIPFLAGLAIAVFVGR